jgi:hypothetical protein
MWRCGGPHCFVQKRPRTFALSLQRVAVVEVSKNLLSRDLWCRSIFDFCNKIGTKRTSSDVRSSVAIGGKPDIVRTAISVENDPRRTSASLSIMSPSRWQRGPGLVESHAYPVFAEPDDMATYVHRISAECQGEMFRDANGAGYIECRPAMDRSQTKQVMALPSNSIVAAVNTRVLGAARRSSMNAKYDKTPYDSIRSSDCKMPLNRVHRYVLRFNGVNRVSPDGRTRAFVVRRISSARSFSLTGPDFISLGISH